MTENKIHIIDLGFKGQKNSIAAFLVETSNGPVLIETGPHSTLDQLKAGISAVGYNPGDIAHVFLTHIHLDHAGAAWYFSNLGATVYVHPIGYKHLNDPSRLLASARMIYKDEMDTLWGNLFPIEADRLRIAEDGETFSVGTSEFKSWHTPGHAKHHIAWQIGHDLFTGDLAGVCIHNGPVIPPCPPPDIQIEVWKESLERILEIREIQSYYLTHFGRITDLKGHQQRLIHALEEYSEFFLPHAKAGRSANEVLEEFRSFVRDFLIQQGMTPDDADVYEAANPSDMSATGLLRYWNKKLTK